MKIVSRSLREAEEDIPSLNDDWSVVSILAPEEPTPEGVNLESPYHLRFKFHDVHDDLLSAIGDPESRNIHPPQKPQIRRLIEHADTLLERNVYVHCAAGVSRSTASAFTLWCIHLGKGKEREALRRVVEDRTIAYPNSRIVRFADELLGRDGRMIHMLSGIEDIRADIEGYTPDEILTLDD